MTAVIFDCDGTLVDSEPLARRAWERTLADYGYEPGDDDFSAVVGRSFETVHAYFASRVELPGAERFWVELRGELFELLDAELRPFADALVTVDELLAARIPVAVASSSSRERLDHTLLRAGIRDRFEVSVAGDEIEHGKPEPDLFLAAASELGADPAACVVVEDAPAGVVAGLAAGAAVLAVARAEPDREALAGAHAIVDEISRDAVERALAARATARAPARPPSV